jgi:hypothetical protein
MLVRRDIAKRHGIVCRPLNLAARKHPGRIAVDQQAQQQRSTPTRDSCSSSRSGPGRRPLPPRTAPDADREAIHPQMEAANILCHGQSRGSWTISIPSVAFVTSRIIPIPVQMGIPQPQKIDQSMKSGCCQARHAASDHEILSFPDRSPYSSCQ